MSSETCRRCGYGIPSSSAICPGCARRHVPSDAAFARLASASSGSSPLLRTARRARRAIFLTGWLALAFALGSLGHVAVHLDKVTAGLAEGTPERVSDAMTGVAAANLAGVALVLVTTVLWARRSGRNARALGLPAGAGSAWSLAGWFVPGRAARDRRRLVDAEWRETSPVVATLHRAGDSRGPLSRVVVRWWALWLWVPAVGVLAAAAAGTGLDEPTGAPELGLAGVAAAAALVAALRSLYDVIGIVTVAHAHRVGHVVGGLPDDDGDAQSHLDGSADGAASNWSSASLADSTTT